MRITTSMMMDKYKNNLENNLARLDTYSNQISTQRKFSRASEDPIAAMQTLNATETLTTVTQYKTNLSSATSFVKETDSATSTVSSILESAYETLIAAANGTNSSSSYSDHATSLESYQEELVQALNTAYGDQYVYGGSTSGKVPFKVGTADDLTGAGADIDPSGGFTSSDVVGKLLYNIPNTDYYIPASAINNTTDTASAQYKYSVNNPAMNYTMPIDLGMGMTVTGGIVQKGTAFEAFTSPLSFLLLDTNGTGSSNVYDTLSTAISDLRNSDTSGMDSIISKVQDAQDAVTKTTVSIGEKENMLDYLQTKLTDDYTNTTERLSSVEDVDVTLATTNYEMSQMVYQASLSICSNVLQNSIFDYLRT